jgi:hypothetical protein
MDSRDFFDFHQKSWRNKQGVYVIENELFSKQLGKPIFKIGYAKYCLSTRLSNYRTAYSEFIPFKIHLIYEVNEKVRGKRPNFALLTEGRIHNTLKKKGVWASMEWFYSIDDIVNVISSIRLEHLKEIDVAKKWTFYTTHISKMVVDVDSEKNVSSKLLGDLQVMNQEEKDRRQRTASKDLDLRDRTKVIHRTSGRKLNIPTTYIDEDGKERVIKKK